MNLTIKVEHIEGVLGKGSFKKYTQYRSPGQSVDIGMHLFSDDQLRALAVWAKEHPKTPGARAVAHRISTFRNILTDPSGKKIGRLNQFEEALRAYIAPTPNKWLFRLEDDGYAVPYYVESIEHHPARQYQDAHVAAKLRAVTRSKDDSTTISVNVADLGKTVPEILRDHDLYIETEEAVTAYKADVAIYKAWSDRCGVQFRARGSAYSAERYSRGTIAMERDGVMAPVVMDDGDEEDDDRGKKNRTTATAHFWNPSRKPRRLDDGEDAEDELVVVPVHPHVWVFDLQKHEHVLIHVQNLEPYVYDTGAADKLVLDKDTKELLHILVEGSAEVMEDIVAGKTGGTIVIATGPPGTGKTLSAEVFAEKIERPLYVVQCSQLGTDEEKIEKSLQLVLERATRWRAILLIDEADVYVHERGSDIQQNAIVGVFLRVLEHYRGVLFLTSNRDTIIDDAIMSRATARIRYAYPSTEQLKAIWTVLSKQYNVAMSPQLIGSISNDMAGISGRNVKNLLKLARMLKKKPSLELFRYVARFLDLERGKHVSGEQH
jgi:hypothetical protein